LASKDLKPETPLSASRAARQYTYMILSTVSSPDRRNWGKKIKWKTNQKRKEDTCKHY
jgi:hypothetical protein